MVTMVMVFGFLCSQCGSGNKGVSVLFEENGANWFEGGDAHWEFKEKELTGTSTGAAGFVMTRESYKNFELLLEFYPDSTVNSGIFVRCAHREISNIDCYEMNIWDLHPDQKSRTGSIVTRADPIANVETLNKWNTYRLVLKGGEIKTWVNDILTINIKNQELKEGYIALQTAETGTIKFRNVTLTTLEGN